MTLLSSSTPVSCTGPSAQCESVWSCARGRTRLECQLRAECEQQFAVEVVRNGRLFGAYQFDGRVAAMVFAGRLLHTFEANGWTTA